LRIEGAEWAETGAALRPLLVLAGPTAVGKSAMAVELGARLGGEVVSADSMQVYRGMDIATDKPSMAERRGVPHHLVDVADPEEPFNAARYRELALEAIDGILKRGRLPILAGGTGLYMKAVLGEFALPPKAPEDAALRRRLETVASQPGGAARLHEELARIDPETAQRLHPHDTRRVIRALEVYETTGRPPSGHLEAQRRVGSAGRFFAVRVGLLRSRRSLGRRIEERVRRQLEAGLVEEAARVLDRQPAGAAQALGHKEMIPYLKGEQSLEEAARRLVQATRRYAKRQLTWFFRDPALAWFDLDALGPAGADAVEAHVRRSFGSAGISPWGPGS